MARPSPSTRSGSVSLATALGLLGPGVLASSSASAAWCVEPEASQSDFDRLIAEAERQRSEGDHATAARSYSRAYDGLPEAAKLGLRGELAIENALDAYLAAYDEQPQQRALLQECETLLGDFVDLRAAAHLAGQSEPVPPRLELELERLRDLLHDEPSEPAPTPDPEPVSPSPSPTDSRADAAVLAGGAVALAGGAALIGAGVWNFAVVNRRSDARIDALIGGNYSPERQQEFQADLSVWKDQWRRTATGLTIAGSVLATTGIVLTTWGVLRMRQRRTAPEHARLRGAPMLVPGGAGVSLSLRAPAPRPRPAI